MPCEFAEILATPSIFDLPKDLRPRSLPATRVWVAIAARLWDIGLIKLRAAGLVRALDPKDPAGISRAGIFGVAKKLTNLMRRIIDRRRDNANELDVLSVLRIYCQQEGVDVDRQAFLERLLVLPHGAQCCDLYVPRTSRLNINVDDISDFYYTMAWPEARVRENSVGFPVPGPDLVWAGAQRDVGWLSAQDPNERLECCLSAPGMGDQKAALCAQMANASCLQREGLMDESSW